MIMCKKLIWFTECKFFPSAISKSQTSKVSNYEYYQYTEWNEGKTIILLMDSKRDNSKYFAKLLMVCYCDTCITDFEIYYVVYRIYTNAVSLLYCFYWALYCCRDKHKNKKVLPLLLFTDLGKYFFKVLERPLKDRRRSNKKLAFQSYFVTQDFSTEFWVNEVYLNIK